MGRFPERDTLVKFSALCLHLCSADPGCAGRCFQFVRHEGGEREGGLSSVQEVSPRWLLVREVSWSAHEPWLWLFVPAGLIHVSSASGYPLTTRSLLFLSLYL